MPFYLPLASFSNGRFPVFFYWEEQGSLSRYVPTGEKLKDTIDMSTFFSFVDATACRLPFPVLKKSFEK